MKKLSISAIGKDKPGIVAAFTQVLYQTQCNIEDTSMTILEDQFTMIFIVHMPEQLSTAELETNLRQVLHDFHLQLAIYEIETDQENPDATGKPWMLSVSGPDQTGITYHVTQYIASRAVNIRHLSSKRLKRPQGETLFLMALEVDVPESLSDQQFQQELQTIAQQEHLEIHAEPLEVYTL